MTRISVLLLAFAFAACDTGAPASNAADGSPPITLASQKSADDAFFITNETVVRASGETVLLRINGETIEMTAGQAYLIGEALTRTGFDTLDRRLQDTMAPGPGRRCEPPTPGTGVTEIEGRLYKRCPPPPPPPFLEVRVLDALLDGAAEVTEAPRRADWRLIPGGFVAEN